jgi:hypothetical protein
VLPTIIATSKVPFYFGGGVLAAWAVVLATLGLRNPGFPGGARGQGAVIGLSLVLAAVAMGLAVSVA